MQLKSKEEAQTRIVELKQKASFAVGMAGLQKQKARVALSLDASGSMIPLYEDGTVQQVCARLRQMRFSSIRLIRKSARYLRKISLNLPQTTFSKPFTK